MKLRSIRWAAAALLLLPATAPAQDVTIAFSEIESRLRVSIEQSPEAIDLAWLAGQTGLDFLRDVRIQGAKLAVDSASKSLTVSGTAKVLSVEASVLLVATEHEGKTLLGLGLQIGALWLSELMPKLAGTALQKTSLSGVVLLMGHARLTIPKDKVPASMATFFGEHEVRFVRGTAFHGTLDPRAIPSLPEALSALRIKADPLPIHGSIEERKDGGLAFEAELPAATPPGYPPWLKCTRRVLEITSVPEIRIRDTVECTLEKATRTFALEGAVGGEQLSMSGRMVGDWEKPFGVTWLTLREPGLSLSVASDGKTTAGLSGVFDLGAKSVRTAVTVEGTGKSLVASFRAELEGKLTFSDLADFAEKRLGRKLFDGPLPSGLPELEGVHVAFKAGDDLSLTVGGKVRVLGHEAEALYTVVIDAEGKPASIVGFNLKDWMPSLSLGGGGGGAGGSGSKGSSGLEGFKFPSSLFMFGGRKMKIPSSGLSLDARAFFARGFGFGGGGGGGDGDGEDGKGTPGGGGAGFSLPDFDLDLGVGLSFSGKIPTVSLPKGGGLGKLLSAMGWGGGGGGGGSGGAGGSGLQFSGSGIDLRALLASPGRDAFKDLSLRATLPAGRPKFYPEWLKSTGMTIELTGEPSLRVLDRVEVTLEPKTPRVFDLAVSLDGDGLAMSGKMEGDWEKPLGVKWLTLQEPRINLAVAPSGDAKAGFDGSFKIGQKQVTTTIEVRTKERTPEATFLAKLDSLSVGDLAGFFKERAGSSFLADLDLGNAAQLSNITLAITCAKETSLGISATVRVGGANADLGLWLKDTGKSLEPLLVIRRHAGRLSDLVPALKGKPADLEFPESVWILTPPKAKGSPRVLSAASLEPAAREILSGVYGTGDFEVELSPGIQLGASVPVGKLPPALAKALGIQDPKSTLRLEGSLEMSLDLGNGRPSAAVKSLELRAELPRVEAATARLPLPAWMRVEATSQRTLVLRYEAPSSVAFLMKNDVLADLDGATRHFQLETEVEADAKKTAVELRGRMAGEWKQPFGIKALTLRDVTLSVGGGAGGGAKSGAVSLGGAFDLGRKSGTMQLEIRSVSGSGLSGSFSGSLDSLSFDDLPDLDLFPGMPKEGLERMRTVLGKLPALEEPTFRIEVGGGAPSLTLAAHVDVRGVRANLLAFVAKGASGPQAMFAIRPEKFSLAKLFPDLGKSPIVAPLANVTLDNFGLIVAAGAQKLEAGKVPPEVKDFFVKLTGDEAFDLDLVGGLNIEALLPTKMLPAEVAQVLERLSKTMGQDEPQGLRLRGSVGTSLQDIRLAAALPPITPGKGPKWLKSGQLAIVVTGTPSLMLEAVVTVDADGDLLDLMVEGGVERQGGSVAIALKSALQADTAWTSPFGIEWLEIRRFSGQISLDATGSIGFGGGGDVTIGSKDINVFAWTKINATGVPLGLVLKAKSKEGFALLDLAKLQASIRKAAGDRGPKVLPLDQLPDIALRDIDLLIASRAVPEEGIDSPGFKLKGDLYIPLKPRAPGTKMLAVDCEVSKEGVYAKGALGAFSVGPLTWKDAIFDLEATLASQHLKIHGEVELLGSSSKTDLELSSKGLSFSATRELLDLGSLQIEVESKFDLKKPTFRARAALSNDFAETFSQSAVGEALDVVGKAAGIGAAALNALDNARKGVEELREQFGLPKAIDVIENAAETRVQNAQAEAVEHKNELDALYKEWQATPDNEPVKKKAREVAYRLKKRTYDEGPLSKIAMLERRKDQLERIRSKLRAFENAQKESQRVQAALGDTLERIAAYKGPTIVLKSASIDASLDGLQSLKNGMPVDLDVEVLFCGESKKMTINWVVGKPAQNIKGLVASLMPSVSALVNPK